MYGIDAAQIGGALGLAMDLGDLRGFSLGLDPQAIADRGQEQAGGEAQTGRDAQSAEHGSSLSWADSWTEIAGASGSKSGSSQWAARANRAVVSSANITPPVPITAAPAISGFLSISGCRRLKNTSRRTAMRSISRPIREAPSSATTIVLLSGGASGEASRMPRRELRSSTGRKRPRSDRD